MVLHDKKRRDCKPLFMYAGEQNFIAALMEAIPHDWNEAVAEEIGGLVLEVLNRYKPNHVGRVNTGEIYDLMHRSGENT